jgi:hypothetical protein
MWNDCIRSGTSLSAKSWRNGLRRFFVVLHSLYDTAGPVGLCLCLMSTLTHSLPIKLQHGKIPHKLLIERRYNVEAAFDNVTTIIQYLGQNRSSLIFKEKNDFVLKSPKGLILMICGMALFA